MRLSADAELAPATYRRPHRAGDDVDRPAQAEGRHRHAPS